MKPHSLHAVQIVSMETFILFIKHLHVLPIKIIIHLTSAMNKIMSVNSFVTEFLFHIECDLKYNQILLSIYCIKNVLFLKHENNAFLCWILESLVINVDVCKFIVFNFLISINKTPI